jgi:hypothetical protein
LTNGTWPWLKLESDWQAFGKGSYAVEWKH